MNTHKHSHPHTHRLFSKAYYLHFLNQIFGYKNLRFDNFKPTFGISYWEKIFRNEKWFEGKKTPENIVTTQAGVLKALAF